VIGLNAVGQAGAGEKEEESGAVDRHSTSKKQVQAPSSSLPFDDGFVAKYVSEEGLWRKFPLRGSRGKIEVVSMVGGAGEDGGKREADSPLRGDK
jgi:hypothetical protein